CLHTALSYHLAQIQQRLFWLLSFLYDPQAILRAQDHLTHGTAEKRAYALEIIDVLVSQHLKTSLFPVLDEATPAQRVQRLQAHCRGESRRASHAVNYRESSYPKNRKHLC